MDLKISNYIVDYNWYSFVSEAIFNCPSKQYCDFLNKYLEMSDEHKIKFSYIDIEPAFELLGSTKVIRSFASDEYKAMALNMAATPEDAKVNYIWANGFNFLETMGKRMPNLLDDFIKSDKFQNHMLAIVINNNNFFEEERKKSDDFNKLFRKIVDKLDLEQLNILYQNIYSQITVPNFKIILNREILEKELATKESNPNKNKLKV